MKVLFSALACESYNSAHRGIGRYTTAILEYLSRRVGRENVSVFYNEAYPREIPDVKRRFSNMRMVPFWYPYQDRCRLWGKEQETAEMLIVDQVLAQDIDVYIEGSVFEGLADQAVVPHPASLSHHCLTAAVLYDLIPLVMAETYLTDKITRAWYREKIEKIQAYDILFSISEATRRDAIRLLHLPPEKIVNISGDVAGFFQKLPETDAKVLERYGIRERFLLYTGGMDFRKNIDGLLQGYQRLPLALRQKHQLVIACAIDKSGRADVRRMMQEVGIAEQEVVFTGYVSDHDLVELYNQCMLFIFPSKYEGLGLPVIEAMRCGAPVLGADNSSIREIIQLQEALFDAENPDDIAKHLEYALTHDDFLARLRAYGQAREKDFSWEKSATVVQHALEEQLRSHKKAAVTTEFLVPWRRPRIAFLSPLPPERSGIADYSAELLEVLGAYFDIDLYMGEGECSSEGLRDRYTIRHYQDFPLRAASYDEIVYQMGNSSCHTEMFQYLERYPGIVTLHDFFLSGLINYLAFEKGDNRALYEQNLFFSHGLRGVDQMYAKGVGHTNDHEPMSRKIFSCAERVIVHSSFAKNLCGKFFPSEQEKVCQIPLLRRVPERASRRDEIRGQLGYGKDDFVVASFGFLSRQKMNTLLLSAWARIREECPRMKLAFVGKLAEDDYGVQFKKMMSDCSAGDAVRVTGFVNPEEYRSYLQAVDAGVQLRCMTRGETSAAVLDCMAAALPTIVNDYASFQEYPEDVVVKIPAEPTVDDLTCALRKLYESAELRRNTGDAARQYVETYHAVETVAKQYAEVIRSGMAERNRSGWQAFALDLGRTLAGEQQSNEWVERVAACYRENHAVREFRRVFLYLDEKGAREMLSLRTESLRTARCIECVMALQVEKDGIIVSLPESRHPYRVLPAPRDVLLLSVDRISDELISFALASDMDLYLYGSKGAGEPSHARAFLGWVGVSVRSDNAIPCFTENEFWQRISEGMQDA